MDEINFKKFLETTPPGKGMVINDFSLQSSVAYTPKLQLHCTDKECQGIRFFGPESSSTRYSSKHNNNFYLVYKCNNCNNVYKTFSIMASFDKELKHWSVTKYGEDPAFGPPIPPRAVTLIGGERDLFLLGRRNENQSMGIGAFVYYRRVIENQKNRIFDELIRVVSKISPDDAVLVELEAAKKETQFATAVQSIKHALPQSLNINGYNPLTLLHSALSEGVHALSDSECLELASSIRAVLFEFAERLAQALKEEAELNAAVNRLANGKKSN